LKKKDKVHLWFCDRQDFCWHELLFSVDQDSRSAVEDHNTTAFRTLPLDGLLNMPFDQLREDITGGHWSSVPAEHI